MTDYATVEQAKSMLGGQWGADRHTGSGQTRDQILADLVTRCSRMFDSEVGAPRNHFVAGTGVTRRYSGNGGSLLQIDEWDVITSVTLWYDQAGASTQVMSTSDLTSAFYVQRRPFQGPPYSSLYFLGTWPIDSYGIGNVVVVGNLSTPEAVAHAVAWWASRIFLKRDAPQDFITRADGTTVAIDRGIPPETKRVIDSYKARFGGAARHGVGEIVLKRPSYYPNAREQMV